MRHQRRNTTQCSLILGEAGQFGSALGVRDRCRQQLGKVPEARLNVERWALPFPGADNHHAPQTPLDDHRRPDR